MVAGLTLLTPSGSFTDDALRFLAGFASLAGVLLVSQTDRLSATIESWKLVLTLVFESVSLGSSRLA